MANKIKSTSIESAILILIAIFPLVYFNQVLSVPFKAFILGSGSWGFGCIFKIVAHQLIVIPLQKNNNSVFLTSLVNGFLSGFFELLAAYILIVLMKGKFVFTYHAIICFGLAIGSLETMIAATSRGNNLFKGTALEKSSEKMIEYLGNLKGKEHYLFNFLLPIAERIMCTFIHISTRGLVFIAIITNTVLPILIALLVFIIADGFLGYYFHITGKLATSRGYVQIHLYLFILAVINTAIFFVLMNPHKNIAL